MTRKRHLRVLSYNIHKGFSTGNNQFVLRRMKEAIELVHADLVFLQEVVGHHEVHGSRIVDWPTNPQFEFLADRLWSHFAYGKNAVYTEGHHGNALLSKYPITFWENLDISTNRLESRGLLHAAVDVPGLDEPMHAICLHLGLFETGRTVQIKRLCERIEKMVPRSAPLVVAGDFNDWRERATGILEKRLNVNEVFQLMRGEHARTFPSWLPVFKLDRIYFRGLELMHGECMTGKPWSELSDHTAIFAELRFE